MTFPSTLPAQRDPIDETLASLAVSVMGLFAVIQRVFPPDPAAPVSAFAIIRYLCNTRLRLIRLLARLRRGVAPRIRAPRQRVARAVPTAPRQRLPRRRAWLATAIGWYGRGFAHQIQHALNTPEIATLIAASPQAHRLLRPLCHMLALDVPSVVPLPRRPRKPRPRPAAPARTSTRRLTRKEREAILWYPNSEGRPMKLLPKKLPRD